MKLQENFWELIVFLITAKKFGLGNEVLKGFYFEEKKGIVPSTKWKKKYYWSRGLVSWEKLL